MLTISRKKRLALQKASRERHAQMRKDVPSRVSAQPCPEFQYPKSFSQAVLTRSAKKAETHAKGELLSQIKELADDESIILGPEAYSACNRDKDARMEETTGRIHLHVINNSATHPVSDQILAWLVGLRNVVSQGLPHMDRSYISKLVFDPKHRNLVIVEKGDVIGGVCFRMFPTQNFSEIVLLSVTIDKHKHGYGTHLMNHLKDYHVKHNIFILLTFAADAAVEFFEKQGFSEEIRLPESVYRGYIHVYHGARLMECRLERLVPYTEFSEIVSRQKKVLKNLIEKYHIPACSSHKVK